MKSASLNFLLSGSSFHTQLTEAEMFWNETFTNFIGKSDGMLAGIIKSNGIAATLTYMIAHRGGWSWSGVAFPSLCLMNKVVRETERLVSWMRGGEVLNSDGRISRAFCQFTQSHKWKEMIWSYSDCGKLCRWGATDLFWSGNGFEWRIRSARKRFRVKLILEMLRFGSDVAASLSVAWMYYKTDVCHF